MSTSQRVFVLAGGADWEGQLLTHIDVLPHVRLVRRCIDVADLIAASTTDHADVALVDPAVPGLDLEVVGRLARQGIDLWAVGHGGDQLGIEYSIPPDELHSIGERLRESAETGNNQNDSFVPRANEPQGTLNRSTLRGAVTAVWGPTGAPGRSMVALAVAAVLARRGESTLLIDADCRGASIAQMLAILDDVSGIMAACRDVNLGRDRRIDEHLLSVMPHLDVLTGIPRADLWHHIRPAALKRVVEQARNSHQHIVIDCGFDLELEEPVTPAIGDIARVLLEDADRTVVVGRPDPVGITRLLRATDSIADIVPEMLLVMNGIRPSTPWDESQLADMVFHVAGARPAVFLPFDAEVCDRALLKGEPVTEVASDSALSRELERLGDMISSTLEPVVTSRL